MNDANFRPGVAAQIIKDSIGPSGIRLTTVEVTMHRWVLAELNTHRTHSRNSASSRAIPFGKQVNRVMAQAAVPVKWATEKKGMQGGEPLTGDDAMDVEEIWLEARSDMVKHAMKIARRKVHKSIVNRLLEPFMWHTVILTATEWEGFFHQRVSPLAQPEIEAAAHLIKIEFENSEPTEIDYGDWHLPYITTEDIEQAYDEAETFEAVDEMLKRISAARCARVSYLTHEGVRDLSKDFGLAKFLASQDPMHASPFEHVATPCQPCDESLCLPWPDEMHTRKVNMPKSHWSPAAGEGWVHEHPGNLRGWFQYRHELQRSPYVPVLPPGAPRLRPEFA